MADDEDTQSATAEQRRKHAAYMREYGRRRRAAGLCVSCGKPNVGATTLCDACRDQGRKTQAARKVARLAAAACHRCGLPRFGDAQYCRDCRDKHLSRTARKTERYKRDGICVTCGRPRDREGTICSACNAKSAARTRRLKEECFAGYGGARCSCCGVTTLEFLTIDHVAGDGAACRKAKAVPGSGCGAHLYGWLIRNGFPPGFRVLCWNCNCARAVYGVCPHERGRQDARD